MVTSIIAGHSSPEHPEDDDAILVSGSRDKTLIIWELFHNQQDNAAGRPLKCLTGHNHFISDLSISNDNTFVISSSWDKTMRLWDLRSGKCVRNFIGHTKEVHTCTFSADNRQIFSAGSEKSLKLWNTLAECKVTSNQAPNQTHDHKDWVSKVRFSQSQKNQYYASTGWDGRLKIWNGIFRIIASIKAHDSYINALDISKNGMWIATGGKDQTIKLWDYTDLKVPKTELKTESCINALAFNTLYQWLAVATDTGFKIYELATENRVMFAQMRMGDEDPKKKGSAPTCNSICWSANGKKIYAGCSDGNIYVYNEDPKKKGSAPTCNSIC